MAQLPADVIKLLEASSLYLAVGPLRASKPRLAMQPGPGHAGSTWPEGPGWHESSFELQRGLEVTDLGELPPGVTRPAPGPL